MREIVLDTETTGFEPTEGDRIVEIGAVELFNHMPTGRTYHQYINPQRMMPKAAFEVHGLGDDFLRDKPLFRDIAQAFLDFVGTDRMVIHNASFDMKFLNHELALAGRQTLSWGRVTDTLAMARDRLPNASASLDALCQRFGVDNSGRELHGALLDSQLLAEVYLELVGGRQTAISFDAAPARTDAKAIIPSAPRRRRPTPLRPRLTEAEQVAHAGFIARIGDAAIWHRYDG